MPLCLLCRMIVPCLPCELGRAWRHSSLRHWPHARAAKATMSEAWKCAIRSQLDRMDPSALFSPAAPVLNCPGLECH